MMKSKGDRSAKINPEHAQLDVWNHENWDFLCMAVLLISQTGCFPIIFFAFLELVL